MADSLDTIARHMLEVSAKLKVGDLSGTELHLFGDMLSALAETVHLYADKLGSPEAEGRHPSREPPPAR
ncbi:hypothetical protein OG738_03765 [Amycolatopsis sp. NBC_01488]|uniref:hypothetical protein n=1 Tax=Amycolatopsis sp. NBC_01488 TaxID=2903563 RepID=UPI002E298C3D|nr:hypothetical protein [Amycolatopsis sp. NBC_01488]